MSTAELVEQAVRAGLLRETSAMNGTGTDYVSVGTPDAIGQQDVFIGTLPGKENYGEAARVYVSVRIAHRLGQEHETTDHRTVSDFWELSICGATTTAVSRRQQDIDSGGQNIETVERAHGAPANLAAFIQVWRDYHLTGMQAACDHQTVVWEDEPYRRPSLDLTPACPVTGYRYGHKWLVKDLPASAVQTVLDFLTAAKEN